MRAENKWPKQKGNVPIALKGEQLCIGFELDGAMEGECECVYSDLSSIRLCDGRMKMSLCNHRP